MMSSPTFFEKQIPKSNMNIEIMLQKINSFFLSFISSPSFESLQYLPLNATFVLPLLHYICRNSTVGILACSAV